MVCSRLEAPFFARFVSGAPLFGPWFEEQLMATRAVTARKSDADWRAGLRRSIRRSWSSDTL